MSFAPNKVLVFKDVSWQPRLVKSLKDDLIPERVGLRTFAELLSNGATVDYRLPKDKLLKVQQNSNRRVLLIIFENASAVCPAFLIFGSVPDAYIPDFYQ
jgi:hypothetical protein